MARILVIDDDQFFVKIMVRVLRDQQHEVEFALDGLAGEAAFTASHFDLVICDLVMPQQEGLQTIRQMRSRNPDTAILAISGGMTIGKSKSLDILELAAKIGADMILKKPFKPQELVSAVVDALWLNKVRLQAAIA